MADTDLYPESRKVMDPTINHDKNAKGKDRTSMNQKLIDIFTTGKSNEEILIECNQVRYISLYSANQTLSRCLDSIVKKL